MELRFPLSYAVGQSISQRNVSIHPCVQSCLTLCDPMDCSLPGSSVHGLFQARVLEWGAIAFSEHLSSYLDILSLRTLLTLERQEEKALRITCIPPTPIFNYCWHFAYIFPDYLLCSRMFIKNKIIL